jgi:hypothetical protein
MVTSVVSFLSVFGARVALGFILYGAAHAVASKRAKRG